MEYHNIVAQPTEHQQEMDKALSERASQVHSGSVDPSEDNMLKITSDGRKLGLDQRIVNQMLPDEPGTKVNQCVENIMQIWRDGEADKLTCLLYTSKVNIHSFEYDKENQIRKEEMPVTTTKQKKNSKIRHLEYYDCLLYTSRLPPVPLRAATVRLFPHRGGYR